MQRLTRDHRIYFLDPENQPAITIDSGEELEVETWDAFEGVRDAAVFQAKTEIGPAIGPIYVNGAKPGDALRIEFLSIQPRIEEGAAHMVTAGRGFLTDRFREGICTRLVLEDGEIVLPSGVRIPMRPSMGFVGTTPTYRQSTASDSGAYGGDIDMQELVSGTTLWLPVFVEGGLLALGDCHAAACDGAVAGTAAECASDTRIRVTVEPNAGISSPRALTAGAYVVLSYDHDIGVAMRRAVSDMVDALVQTKGMTAEDAYVLLGLAADIRLSRTFRDVSSVKMMLSRSVFEQIH